MSKQFLFCLETNKKADTDNFSVDPDRLKELNSITKYCNDHNYELITFCLDIEDVYLGNTVSNTQKVKAASKFTNKDGVTNINEKNRHKSNILLVLNQLFVRKKQ